MLITLKKIKKNLSFFIFHTWLHTDLIIILMKINFSIVVPFYNEEEKNDELIKAKLTKLKGLTTTGQKIDLSKFDKPTVKNDSNTEDAKKKRKRIIKKKIDPRSFNKFKKSPTKTVEISPEEAQKRVRETLAKLQGSGKKSSVKNRKEKREAHKAIQDQEIQEVTTVK